MQSPPLAVTLGAALFLGEPVGWRRWSAIAIGFSGVLLILRPTADGFASASLLVIAAVFFPSGRDLTPRRIVSNIPSLTTPLFNAAANPVVGVGLVLPMVGRPPPRAPSFPPRNGPCGANV